MEPPQQRLSRHVTLRVCQKVGQQLMMVAPVAWITEIYLAPSLLFRPMFTRGSRSSWPFCLGASSGGQPEQEDAAGLEAIAPARRCALLLMVMNIQPPLSSTRTRLLAAPLTTVQWASTAIMAAEPGAARCSRRRASTLRGAIVAAGRMVAGTPDRRFGVSTTIRD